MSTPQIRTRAVNGAARVRHHATTAALTVVVLGVAAAVELLTGWPPFVTAPAVVAVLVVGILR